VREGEREDGVGVLDASKNAFAWVHERDDGRGRGAQGREGGKEGGRDSQGSKAVGSSARVLKGENVVGTLKEE